MPVERVFDGYRILQAQRLLVLDADGTRVRMAPPFSGVATPHRPEVDGVRFFANLGLESDFWDPKSDRFG